MIELVADSNVLFGYFWKNSVNRHLILNVEIKSYSPNFALKEISKYKEEIINKARISKKEFEELFEELKSEVEFVEEKYYLDYLKNANNILDINDIEFVALAMKLKLPIWSNDKELKIQNLAPVLNTEELISILF